MHYDITLSYDILRESNAANVYAGSSLGRGRRGAASSILHYTILYYTILYYTILYYTTLHYTIITLAEAQRVGQQYIAQWQRRLVSSSVRQNRVRPIS